MSEEHRNTNQKGFDNEFKQAFEAWDGGEPSADVWSRLEESLVVEATWSNLEEELSVEHVWNRLNTSLDAHVEQEAVFSENLQQSFEAWKGEAPGDGWMKLSEELSRESVWQRLLASLNRPVLVRIPLMKMAASTLLFVMLSFYTNYNVNSNMNQSHHADAVNSKIMTNATNEKTELAINNVNPVGSDRQNASKGKNKVQFATKQIGVVPEVTIANNTQEQNNAAQFTTQVVSTTNQVNAATKELDDDFASLGKRELESIHQEMLFFGKPKSKRVYLKPRWSIGVGTQLSVINEQNRNSLTSVLPKLGWAGDVSSHIYFGQFRWTNGLGFGQYSQGNGKYLNGRYQATSQRLNTAYFMSAGGYVYKAFTFYGGVTVNKLLNGYEENSRVMTNVYNSKNIQLGGVAGIDYNFKPFKKNRSCLGVNVQYQFIPELKSSNQVFNDIHGLRFQIKFSF